MQRHVGSHGLWYTVGRRVMLRAAVCSITLPAPAPEAAHTHTQSWDGRWRYGCRV